MNESVLIYNVLCLPAPDVEALIEGRIIAAMPRILLNSGHKFALYPVDYSANQLSIQQYYRPSFLPTAQTAIKQVNSKTVSIKAWAKCERCQMLDKTKPLDVLSQLTIWKPEVFEAILQKQRHFFLAYLRVYHLSQFCEVPANPAIQGKVGKFVSLPNSLSVSEAKPVISTQIFTQRKHQLETLQPPQHPELEELQSALSQISKTNPAAKQLDDDIKMFLGWSSEQPANTLNSQLDWIKTIATLGNRSIEEEKKSNYQAGTDFENIARDSLDFLGFKVEENYKGGAGGLDLFCSKPYPLVCECKAGRLIPSRTVEELLKLGGMHLGKDKLLSSSKLVIGPGKPSPDTLKAAKEWEVSIINAMTLQKLVELKAKYPGAINLVELQKYLQPGQIDHKIDEYIDKIEIQIKLRSHIIQLVKKHLEKTGAQDVKIDGLHIAYIYDSPPQNLQDRELYDILIELSSPLIGYLGRIKEDYWKKDRFYYLRDLPTN